MPDMRDMTFAELVELGACDEIPAGAGWLEAPALADHAAQRALIRLLYEDPRFSKNLFGRNGRKVFVHPAVGRRDREVLELLERVASDADHPLRVAAIEELLATRDKEIVAPLYERFVPAILDGHPFGGYTHQLALGATYLMGADAVVREIVPRYLTEKAIAADPSGVSRASAVIFELIHQLGAKVVAADDPRLVDAALALESFKPLKVPLAKLLKALDAKAIARARGGAVGSAPVETAASKPKKKAPAKRSLAEDAAPGAYLARYDAGEHQAVWTELRAFGEAVHDGPLAADARAVALATMKAFVANVQTIAKTLAKAKYRLAEKKAVRPPRRDVGKVLEALAKQVGPLPLAFTALYETCDGVTLAQDVHALVDESPLLGPGVLDELGRMDPLVVAPLATLVADVEQQRARGVAAPRLYLSPDPACKGDVDDEIPDETPVRMIVARGVDADLEGAGTRSLVAWLHDYVEAGGFLGSLGDGDRATLRAGVRPF